MADVHAAVLEGFRRTGIVVAKDETSKKGELTVEGCMQWRSVRVYLTPLTPALTAMKLVVKRNVLMGDKATASELVGQTERVLSENPAFAPLLLGIGTTSELARSRMGRDDVRPRMAQDARGGSLS
jgi:hypothetical protein